MAITAKHYPIEQRERAVKKVLDGATVRGFPDLAPVVVRTTAGRPAAIPAELRLPPELHLPLPRLLEPRLLKPLLPA